MNHTSLNAFLWFEIIASALGALGYFVYLCRGEYPRKRVIIAPAFDATGLVLCLAIIILALSLR